MDLFTFSPQEWQAVRLSLLVSLVSVAGSLPAGLAIGYFLARRSFVGRSLVEALLNLPLVVPPVVTGYALLVLLGPNGLIGGPIERLFGARLVFTWQAAAIAAAVISFPLMVRSIRLAFSSVDLRLEGVAMTLGARPWDVFWSVSLPSARRGVIAGCVLAFARSMGEFGATIMVAGSIPGETRTVPLQIFENLQVPGGMGGAPRLVLASVIIAAAALAASELLERRGRLRRPRSTGKTRWPST